MKLEEFDQAKQAIINPDDVVKQIDGCPQCVVTCFAHNLVEHALQLYDHEIVGSISSANGTLPLYRIHVGSQTIGIIMSFVGAPACIGEYEELFAMGVKQIVVFGTCGVLDHQLDDCAIILPDAAVREEGCSYHYVESSAEIKSNVGTLDQMKAFFSSKGIDYTVGKVWTTDALYRETAKKAARRKAEGCICVDMECSAIAALAQFREKKIAQFFYSADSLANGNWDKRSLANHDNLDVKKEIVALAIELGLRL